MAPHKFHVGEIVSLRPVVSRNAPSGAYEVAKQLPYNGRRPIERGFFTRDRGIYNPKRQCLDYRSNAILDTSAG